MKTLVIAIVISFFVTVNANENTKHDINSVELINSSLIKGNDIISITLKEDLTLDSIETIDGLIVKYWEIKSISLNCFKSKENSLCLPYDALIKHGQFNMLIPNLDGDDSGG